MQELQQYLPSVGGNTQTRQIPEVHSINEDILTTPIQAPETGIDVPITTIPTTNVHTASLHVPMINVEIPTTGMPGPTTSDQILTTNAYESVNVDGTEDFFLVEQTSGEVITLMR